jgi:NADH-quinone oxidoreductase subunit J
VELLADSIILYLLIALGAVGVCLALPRRGVSPQLLGGILAAVAGGLVVLILSLRASRAAGPDALPNVFFYIFAAVALGAALRVITHPRPVYAALYFILTVLASAGLFLLLSAEFMAFALVIIYAGAIIITYLFVIMLATQAPEPGREHLQAEYDTVSREPVAATTAGFVVLAVLTAMLLKGGEQLPPTPDRDPAQARLAHLPRKIEQTLRERDLIAPDAAVVRTPEGHAVIDPNQRRVQVTRADGSRDWAPLPDDLGVSNVEGLGFSLLDDHPGSIEIAGVVLLMAMLGAVVLSRKQVEIDEELKRRRARQLAAGDAGGAAP